MTKRIFKTFATALILTVGLAGTAHAFRGVPRVPPRPLPVPICGVTKICGTGPSLVTPLPRVTLVPTLPTPQPVPQVVPQVVTPRRAR